MPTKNNSSSSISTTKKPTTKRRRRSSDGKKSASKKSSRGEADDSSDHKHVHRNTLTQMGNDWGFRPSSRRSVSFRQQEEEDDVDLLEEHETMMYQQYDDEGPVVYEQEIDEEDCPESDLNELVNTMSQADLWDEDDDDEEEEAAEPRDYPFQNDYKSKVYYLKGDKVVMFCANETWMVPKPGALNSHVYYTFQRFEIEALRLNGIVGNSSNLCMDLSATFIGPKQTLHLLNNENWLRNHPVDPDKAFISNTLPYLVAGRKQLADIDKASGRLFKQDDRPKPTVFWETDEKKLNFAYRARQQTSQPGRVPPRKPVVLDLFAGCGGMSLGFRNTGFFDLKYAVEKDHVAAATHMINFPDADLFEEDVNDFLEKSEKKFPTHPGRGDVDHVHASTPCPGFSLANRSGGKNDMRNNNLSLSFIKAVEVFLPRTASFENVTGMLREENRAYLQTIVRNLMELDYQVRVCVLNAKNYGDPQDRNRVIIFAARWDVPLPKAPEATHSDLDGLARFRSVRDALHDLENVEPGKSFGPIKLANGRSVNDHNVDGTKMVCEEKYYLKGEESAQTVKTQNPVRHYNEALDRNLTIRERARLQSFPDSFRFAGSGKDRRQQIGNAVPVGRK